MRVGDQMSEEDLLELKFRLYDGSDIGPIRFASASTVAAVKARVIADWPKDKKLIPKSASDIKLISAGKILENQKTIAQCQPSLGDYIITMHVVVQPSLGKSKTGGCFPCDVDILTCPIKLGLLSRRVSLSRSCVCRFADRYFVRMSAGRSFVWIYRTFRSFNLMCSLMKWKSISMCLFKREL